MERGPGKRTGTLTAHGGAIAVALDFFVGNDTAVVVFGDLLVVVGVCHEAVEAWLVVVESLAVPRLQVGVFGNVATLRTAWLGKTGEFDLQVVFPSRGRGCDHEHGESFGEMHVAGGRWCCVRASIPSTDLEEPHQSYHLR